MQQQQYRDLAAWGYPAEKLERVLLDWALRYCIWKKKDPTDPYYTYCEDVLHQSKLRLSVYTWKQILFLGLFNYCPPLFGPVCVLYKNAKTARQK